MPTSYPYIALKIQGERIDQHRLIMQNHLGRKLTFNEVVHHINGDQKDNRIENLQVLTRSEHAKLHWASGDYNITTANTPARIAARDKTAAERGKKVMISDTNGNDLMIVRSIKMACRVTGTPSSTLHAVLTGRDLKTGLFKFRIAS